MRQDRFDFRPHSIRAMLAVVIAATIGILVGCSPSDPPKPVVQMEARVSFQTLESNRVQAQTNAEFVAQRHRAEDPTLDQGYKIEGRTDSTITNDCPQGDGWATVHFTKVEGKAVDKRSLKCSTVSASLGCYPDSEFAKKPFAQDDGRCQPQDKVPFPLPKLGK